MAADGIHAGIAVSQYQAMHLILLFDLKHSHRKNSSETNFLYIGELNHLIIEVRYHEVKPGKYEYTLTIRGSLHKYCHDNNAGDFIFPELQYVKDEIYKIFNIDAIKLDSDLNIKPVEQILLSLDKSEVGINVLIGIDDLHEFLDINLLQHKKKPFMCNDGLVFVCKHENYQLKIYAKAENLLRVEIVLLTKELRKYKIYTLADLTREKIIPILKRLKIEFSEIIFSDGINIHSCEDITKKEELKLLRFTSDWRNKQYLIDQKESGKRKSKKAGKNIKKNLAQKLYRLGVDSKTIFKTKGKGYKKILVDAVNQKIDSMII